MSGFEFNKIFAAIILAIIIIVFIGKVGDIGVKNIDEKKTETAYKVDIPESNTADLESSIKLSSDIEPVSKLLSSASLENGKKIYKKCGTCHNDEKGSKSKVGPNLWEIINRPKGGIDGFAYSNALIKHGGKWTFEELNGFLYKPKDYINGTKMNFVGLKKEQDRADLILYLRELSDNPVLLP